MDRRFIFGIILVSTMLQPTKITTAFKTKLKRDVKLMQEMEQETAKILSPLFNDTVWLNRAYLMLKGQNLPESEGRFKTLVLVLNGRIRHSWKLSFDVGTLHTAKIFSHILELDALIREVMELPRTPSLDHFQSFAKGILFRSMGDTFLLLHNMEKGNRTYEDLAFVSYSIAFDIFHKASPVSSLLAAIFVLETLILHTLLQYFNRIKSSNSITQPVGERLYTACNGLSTSRSKSFMISINSIPNSHETYGMEQNKINRLIILADKNDFLINLLWLLAYNNDIRNNASFLDIFLKNIPAEASDDDLQSFTLSSLSKIDAKVLLLGAAKWSELCASHGQKYATSSLSILPPLAFTQPGYMVLSFWNLLVSFISKDARISRSSQLCFENGLIITALEASRLRGEIPDVRIVDYVRKWLVANGNELGDKKGNWTKLYSRVFMDLINGAHYANQGISAEESFFPSLNDSDYDMLDDAEKWFSSRDSSTACNLKNDLILDDSSELKQVDILPINQPESTNDASVKPKSFLQRISTSAKTMLPSEYHNLAFSSTCASKIHSIRALKQFSKDYEARCKYSASVSYELNDLLAATKENTIEENLYGEIIKMQNEHAWDVCRLLQTINSLEETIKQYASQYTTDLAIYASKAYKQGYSDGYSSALQTNASFTTVDQHAIVSTTQRADFLDNQVQNISSVEHSHDPKECIGCASEEEQDRFLRILDNLADSGSASLITCNMSTENIRLSRGAKRRGTDDIQDKLFVFGYTSRIYANDDRAEWVAEERHLIAHPADSQLLIDRYDCRLYFPSVEALDIACITAEINSQTGNGYDCPAELLEEEMCEEERYKDMHEDMKKLEQEEEEKQKRAEIAFNYDENCKRASSSSEEEIDELFQPPENIKLPLGMNLPDTMKQNAVIERTATFVVVQGPQMEIVIKAKQRGNQDQFGFLEFDHPLNAYYKYISKLIREKKYTPKPHVPKRRPKLKKLKRLEEEKRLEEQQKQRENVDIDSGSDSDSESDGSGNYLHPLLMGGIRKADFGDNSPVIGPKTKEENDVATKKQLQVKTDYKLGKADDMYSSLFKNLSDLVVTQTRAAQIAESKDEIIEKTKDLEKGDYYEWYLSFYGEPPPSNEQPNVIPPPPDIMPTVNSAAEYVARYGIQAEKILLGRQDLNIGFLCADGPYYGYYHSRIRYYQKLHTSYMQSQKMTEDAEEDWNTVKQEIDILGGYDMEQSCKIDSDSEQSSKPFSDLLQAPPPPPPFMNRKMRRRGFHDPPHTPEPSVQNVTEIGVIDFDVQLNKVRSLPALLDNAEEREESSSSSVKKTTTGPISFSLNIQKADDKKVPKIASAVKLGAYDDENSGTEAVDVPPGVLSNIPPPGLTIPPPPVAPIPLSSGQLAVEGSAELQSERKLKARLFMEKILNEKRAAKLRAQNEEQLKRESELLKKYEESRASSVSSITMKSKNKGDMNDVEAIFSASAIDQLINSRIDKVISEAFKEKKDSKHSKSHHHKKEKRKKREEKREEDNRFLNEHCSKSSKRHRRSRESSNSSERKVSKRKKRKKRRHRSRSSGDENR
ncbi:Protein SWAP [Dirofilaria immitis]